MSKLFEEMAQGTADARAYMEGKQEGYEVHPGSECSNAISAAEAASGSIWMARLKPCP